MPRSITYAFLILAVLLSGCGRDREPEVYTISKETDQGTSPMASSGGMSTAPTMASQQLPADAINQDASNPAWVVPDSWESKPASSMRRGSFSASGSSGEVDIAVTSFPGDVGGLLANINRWRGQIGLPPISSDSLTEATEEQQVNGKTVILTRLQGPGQSTHAAIFIHDDHSWFFKMTGPNASVQEQGPAFMQFIQTIVFPADE